MDPRQLIRIGAVLVAVLVLGLLGWKGYRSDSPAGASSLSVDDPTSYAGVAAGVDRQLEVYGALAQATVSHSQAHTYSTKMEGIEESLAVLRDRAAALGSDDGEQLAVLADFVRVRGLEVRDDAARDHLGMTGIEALQAFGREVSLRALAIEQALEGGDEDDVVTEVGRPWPVPEEEGQDDPVE